MKKYVLCPPCGAVFEEETEEKLVRVTQSHAKKNHGYTPTRDEVLDSMTSTSPRPDETDERSRG